MFIEEGKNNETKDGFIFTMFYTASSLTDGQYTCKHYALVGGLTKVLQELTDGGPDRTIEGVKLALLSRNSV